MKRSALYVALAACFSTGVAANPTGPVVVGGTASFTQSGKSLQITNSPGAVIQWQGFSIGADETTRFIQSNAASTVLNRVVGSGSSQILGQLLSNGRVFLLNPNGVFIGNGAVVDVAGFAASTLRMADSDFLAGRFRVDDIAGAGKIVNRGTIRTPAGGSVFLVAPSVENSGLITSPSGQIILAAGRKVELVTAASPDVRVELRAPDNAVLNVGQVVADAGQVGIFGTTVRNAGTIRAGTARVDASGRVFLVAKDVMLDAGSTVSANGAKGGSVRIEAQGGTLETSGDVSAVGASGKGGDIALLGTHVGVLGTVAASGASGGGTIEIGGSRQGQGPLPNSDAVFIGADAKVNADARERGNGGKLIVFSNLATRIYGELSARGGAEGGDGGFIETSGLKYLDVATLPDATAARGAGGVWLIDPNDLQITAATTANTSTAANTPVAGTTTYATTTDTATLSAATINAALNFGTNVVIQTTTGAPSSQSGDVTFAAGISKSSGAADVSLTI